MTTPLLEIKNLTVSAGDKIILNELNLSINKGETHVLMGQNGAGKSTLGAAVMGSPFFTVQGGDILLEGECINELPTDARARKGLFLSFQTPEEVAGINLGNFLRMAKGAINGETPRILPFQRELETTMQELDMNSDYAKRDLNVGFSGGERKKSEVLQLLTLNPKLAILDETDSGLDVDAVRTVARGVQKFRSEDNSLLIITHNTKLIEEMHIDKVHVLAGGQIVRTGGAELIDIITQQGFCGLADKNGCALADEDGACTVAAEDTLCNLEGALAHE